MKFSVIIGVVTPAVQAMVSYMTSVPESLMALAESSENCNLPDDFQIQNFAAESSDGGKTLTSLDFIFDDDSTTINTACRWNSSSVPVSTGGDGRTARYACDNALVQFIWQNGTVTMIEKICADENGHAEYEASGTAAVQLLCDGSTGNGTSGAATTRRSTRRSGSRRAIGCKSDSDNIRSQFVSIQPVPGG